MAALETGYTIHTFSKDVYVEALRTIPVTPIHAEMTFLAEGFDTPYTRDEERIEKYMRECTIKGIAPYSVTNIQIQDGKIVKSESSVEFPSGDQLSALRETAFLSRLERRREQKVRMEFDIYHQYGSYDAIKNSYLDQILNQGYEVDRAELWLSSYHLSGYNDGDYPATQVTINGLANTGIRMRLDSDESKAEDLAGLRSWFRDLKQFASQK